MGQDQPKSVTLTVCPLAVSSERLATLHAMLDAEEQRRAEAFQLAAAAQQFVVGRGVTRMLLAQHCGCATGELIVKTDARGKPHLRYPARAIDFNLSHSGGFCALAIGEVESVGLDIELIHPRVDDLAASIFTLSEALRFGRIPASARLPAFFRAWVAKEAYLKATGDGLAGGLESLELDFDAGSNIRPIAIRGSRSSIADWQFHSFDLNPSIVGALAIKSGRSEVVVKMHHFDGTLLDPLRSQAATEAPCEALRAGGNQT